jgi:hypothetical protein
LCARRLGRQRIQAILKADIPGGSVTFVGPPIDFK